MTICHRCCSIYICERKLEDLTSVTSKFLPVNSPSCGILPFSPDFYVIFMGFSWKHRFSLKNPMKSSKVVKNLLNSCMVMEVQLLWGGESYENGTPCWERKHLDRVSPNFRSFQHDLCFLLWVQCYGPYPNGIPEDPTVWTLGLVPLTPDSGVNQAYSPAPSPWPTPRLSAYIQCLPDSGSWGSWISMDV